MSTANNWTIALRLTILVIAVFVGGVAAAQVRRRAWLDRLLWLFVATAAAASVLAQWRLLDTGLQWQTGGSIALAVVGLVLLWALFLKPGWDNGAYVQQMSRDLDDAVARARRAERQLLRAGIPIPPAD